MVSFTKLASAGLLAATVLADDGVELFHRDQLTIDACRAIIKKTAIFFTSKDKVGFCNVKNQPALGTMALCLDVMPHKHAIDYFIDECSKYNLTHDQFWAAHDNATKYAIKNVSTVPGFNISKPFNYPVVLKNKTLIGAYDSEIGRYFNYNRANIYSWVLLAYWFVLVLVAGVCRFASFVAPKYVQSFNGKASNLIRKYITMPALFGRKRAEHFKAFKVIDAVLPTRLETFHIFVWFILCVAFNTANYTHDSPNLFWKLQPAEMGRKIADRTGIMALYFMPQLILFAGRNNFLQWISGWSYARFTVIHHWYGRALFILMMVHAVGMTYNGKYIGGGKYETRNAQPYVRWGYVALIACSIMVFHSLSFLRRNNYEGFVLFHNVLGAIVIAGTWLHVEQDSFQTIMYAATAVWAFDKAARLVRMAWFGVRTAEVQLIAGETLKVKVPRPASWKSFPMSHSFIYFFRPTCFWQSHPFTVVDSAVEDNIITVYIKVKGGMSHGLYKYLSTQPEQKARIKCSVEGPYGTREPLQHYSTVAFLAGGNGIPGLYSGALDLTKRATNQKLKFYWVIRHWKSVEWFYEELQRLESTSVQPIVYVTQYDTPLDECFIEKFEESDSSSEEKKSSDEETVNHVERLKSKLSFVEFRAGRPDVEGIIREEIAESSGSIAFAACGHDSFVDASRKITLANLPEGKRVDFYDALQTW